MDTPRDDLDGFDLGRLTRPEADAYRTIAHALGASYAGDQPEDPPRAANDERGEITRLPQRGSSHAVTTADPKRARLLDRVPVPLVVADGDSISFINRTALGILGYGSAAILDAAGGLGALFGSQSGRDGLVSVRTATGRSFPARVEMAPIEWGNSSGLLISVIPIDAAQHQLGSAAVPRPIVGDPLVALLNAVPVPIAIVNRGGDVEACNQAFSALGPNDRANARLDERLNPADLRHLMETVRFSFEMADGFAESAWPLVACGSPYWVSVGALAGREMACVTFQRYSSANDDNVRDGARLIALAELAVSEVRRLIGEASVLLIHRRSGPAAPLSETDARAIQCLRAVLLAAAARANVGSVLTLESSARDITLTLAPSHAPEPFSGVLTDRIVDLGAECGLVFETSGASVVVVEGEKAQTRRTA